MNESKRPQRCTGRVMTAVGLAVALTAPGGAKPAVAQAGTAPAIHHVSVDVAGLVQGLDDAAASPVRYTGGAPAVGLAYRRDGSRWRWAIAGAGAAPRLTSDITIGGAGVEESAWFSAAAHGVRRVWRPSPSSMVWLGPGVAVDARIRRHTYAPGVWLNFADSFAALQAVALAELDLGAFGRLTETFGVPLAGLAVREASPEVVGSDLQVEAALPPAFLFFHHRLDYRIPMTSSLVARAFHQGSLVRHDSPDELAAVSHRVGVAVEWAWGRP